MLINSRISNPLKGFQVNPDEIKMLGKDLQRPECILTEKDGTVWTADARGGVMKINADGTQKLITPFIDNVSSASSYENRYIKAIGSLPNGLCFDKNGDIIIANWGTNHIERMTRDGKLITMLTEIDGCALIITGFCKLD